MRIKIKCRGSGWRKLSNLKVLQGELKELSDENRAKLRSRIEQFGFDSPVYVYKNYILDGTQRVRVLADMIKDGWTLLRGEIPVVEIRADSIGDAKQRLLGYVSQFGKVSVEGLDIFIGDIPDIDFGIIDIPDFDMSGLLGGIEIDDTGYKKPADHVAAYSKLHYALKTGKITKPDKCEKCGDPDPQSHHEDYSKPLDVDWWCDRCHRAHHNRLMVKCPGCSDEFNARENLA